MLRRKTGKPKKPLKRTRIRPRGKFKAFGANPFKTNARKRTDAQVMAPATAYRRERLINRTRAEMAIAEMLDRHRILYEVEKIFLNGDRYILVDFFLKDRVLAIEIDGSAHDQHQSYDAGRDQWLFESYGVRTIRLSNLMVFRCGDDPILGELGLTK